MTYEAAELSRTKAKPITLYHFFPVNGREYRYTDAEKPVTLPGTDVVFRPIAIQHGRLGATGTLDKSVLEISMPKTAEIGEAFRVYPPGEVVNVVVRQMHQSDPDKQAPVVFTGRVLGSAWESGSRITLSCEPISTSMKRPGLRRHYQIGCPHQLYGPHCLANKEAATTPEILVAAITGSTIILPPGWIPSEWPVEKRSTQKFIGGMMVWSLDDSGQTVEYKRTILQINGGTNVVLAGVPTGLAAGSPVKMILGCNHQMTDCRLVHANIKRYGGQPFIPVKNPFGFRNQFY